ncbi:hypothetical protein J6V85_01500 [Candidatus Saccharibacteria bacterium]|nr:hypothetical protein [Candidatus Saccharibacteria bacterium]
MKNNHFIKTLVFGILTICLNLGIINGITFADSNSMTVSPPYQKIILMPGETYNNSLLVSNSTNSTRDLKYSVEIGSFSQSKTEESNDDYGSISHINVTSYNQIMNWIKLDNTGGTLAPGEKTTIGYSIEVPEDAPGGGQYATILVIDETTSNQPVEGSISIDQKFQFASIIYAEVAGETREEGTITENNIPSFILNGPLQASSMVKNNGNVHTDAEYIFQVWPLFNDEEICTNEEKPETSLILPETERYHVQTCELPSVGIFRAKQIVRIFGETSIIEKTIIMCPLWLLFVIIFALVLIIFWLITRFKARKRDN